MGLLLLFAARGLRQPKGNKKKKMISAVRR
jgi:hypothetical protein